MLLLARSFHFFYVYCSLHFLIPDPIPSLRCCRESRAVALSHLMRALSFATQLWAKHNSSSLTPVSIDDDVVPRNASRERKRESLIIALARLSCACININNLFLSISISISHALRGVRKKSSLSCAIVRAAAAAAVIHRVFVHSAHNIAFNCDFSIWHQLRAIKKIAVKLLPLTES
jgi:hypothetical protein